MEYCIKDYVSYKLHMIKTKKFKTINVKVIFSSKVEKNEITIKNFLGDILVHSSKKYKTRKDLSTVLQDLYAMNIFSNCYRIGNLYNMEINASFLNEKYTEKGMLDESIKLLREIILNPNVVNNKFDTKAFSYIKNITYNQIESLKEDTRKLSLIKMLEKMGEKEAYSYHGFGYIEDLQNITEENLFEFYNKTINTNKIDIFIIGDIEFNDIERIVEENFKFKTLKHKTIDYLIHHNRFRKIPKKIVEEAKISQSKLSIGCKIEELNDYERNYVLPIYSMILGGGSDSKLFRNVREKNSLCYYISASANKLDSLLFITSGITGSNFEQVVKLIKKSIKEISSGLFNEEDISKSKIQYITMLDEIKENPFQIMSSYYSIEILNYDDLDTRKEKIQKVSFDDIKKISSKIHVDTIYLLKGEE